MVLFETTTIHSSLLQTSLLFHCFVIGEHGCGRNGAFVENGLDDAAFIHSCAVVCYRYGSGPALVSSCPRRRGTAVVFPRERGKILYIRSFCSHVAPGIMLGHSILDVYASLFLWWFCRHCPRPPPFHCGLFPAFVRGAGGRARRGRNPSPIPARLFVSGGGLFLSVGGGALLQEFSSPSGTESSASVCLRGSGAAFFFVCGGGQKTHSVLGVYVISALVEAGTVVCRAGRGS